jgi:predicted glycosyl hydrolase (DUF1957 family)
MIHISSDVPVSAPNYVSLEHQTSATRLHAKVYEVDPMVCAKCDADMKGIAVIEGPDELKRILRHLAKIGRSPPGFDPNRLN